MRMGHGAQPVDVICQNSKDGTIIPLKIRLVDEDGAVQVYAVKRYKDLSYNGTRTMPDGVYVTHNSVVFECHILILGRYRLIRLYFDPKELIWTMTT